MNATDPLEQIRAYAPPPSPAPLSDELLTRAFASDAQPRPKRRRRTFVAASAAVLVVGAGTASAAGYTPAKVWDTFFHADVPANQVYDTSTAQRVFVMPGPAGRDFAAWTIDNHAGDRCLSTLFEPAGTTSVPAQFRHGVVGASCGPIHTPDRPYLRDGVGSNSPGDLDRLNFVWRAKDAVRAELRVNNGRTYPVVVRDGWLGGWYTREQVPLGATATLVAFRADGGVAFRWHELDQFGCADPAGC